MLLNTPRDLFDEATSISLGRPTIDAKGGHEDDIVMPTAIAADLAGFEADVTATLTLHRMPFRRSWPSGPPASAART
jgi:hypothetical protein